MTNRTVNIENRFDAEEIVIARGKSYTTAAVIVLVLYTLFWLPGLIANLMYWNEARYMEDVAGRGLPGAGALKVELIVFGVLPFVAVVVALAVGVAARML